MAIPRCPICAAPLSTTSTSRGAPACTSCGALLTPAHLQRVSWSSPESRSDRSLRRGPGDRSGDAPSSTSRRKSGALAILLELLIPGTGAMYAGRVGVGFLWLLLSLAALALAAFALARDVSTPLFSTSAPYVQFPTDAAFIPYYAGVGLVALVWFAARAMLASAFAGAYNHRLMAHAMPAAYGSAAYGAHRAASAEASPSTGQVVRTLVTILIEMIPGPIAGYGIGDMATAVEAIFGHTMDGLKLSPTERLVYLGASAIPLIPARPIIAVYRHLTRNTPNQS